MSGLASLWCHRCHTSARAGWCAWCGRRGTRGRPPGVAGHQAEPDLRARKRPQGLLVAELLGS